MEQRARDGNSTIRRSSPFPRSRRGLIPFLAPGADHSAHRLANIGFKQRDAVLVLYGAAINQWRRCVARFGAFLWKNL